MTKSHAHGHYQSLIPSQLHLAEAAPLPLPPLAQAAGTYPLNRQRGDAQHGCSTHPQHQPGIGEHEINGCADAIVILLAFALTGACHCSPEDEGRTQRLPFETPRNVPPVSSIRPVLLPLALHALGSKVRCHVPVMYVDARGGQITLTMGKPLH